MIIKSFSKINLTLRVLKKLKNGMHNIETNSVLTNLFDEINIKKNKKDIIIFKGKFKDKINFKKNSISETLQFLKKLRITKNHYKIVVKKNIPVYAGLGGGTSNSVYVARYILKNNLSEKLIVKLEKKIGSDFRLFLNNSSYQKKLGKVFKTKNNINSFIILVFPNIDCKTKNIYAAVKHFSSPSRGYFPKKIKKKRFIEIIKNDHNDLQKIVEKKYPKVSLLLQSIKEQEGCIFSRMTGSGSVCYGVFKTNKTAELAMIKLKRKYPKYWCVVTKTI